MAGFSIAKFFIASLNILFDVIEEPAAEMQVLLVKKVARRQLKDNPSHASVKGLAMTKEAPFDH